MSIFLPNFGIFSFFEKSILRIPAIVIKLKITIFLKLAVTIIIKLFKCSVKGPKKASKCSFSKMTFLLTIKFSSVSFGFRDGCVRKIV